MTRTPEQKMKKRIKREYAELKDVDLSIKCRLLVDFMEQIDENKTDFTLNGLENLFVAQLIIEDLNLWHTGITFNIMREQYQSLKTD